MTPVKIKILLLKKGLTQTEVGRRIGVTVGMVNHIINRRYQARPTQRAFAELLGISPKKMWPELSWEEDDACAPASNEGK